MADNQTPTGPGASGPTSSTTTPETPPKDKQVDELLSRARQAVKAIITREAANEIVSDDLLNFRMKGSYWE